jgi:hypothetical protein
MFALPPTIDVTGLSFGIGIDWPWLGPLLASMLAAVLVSGFLGLLRASSGGAPAARGPAVAGGRTTWLIARCARALHLPLRTPLHDCTRP